MIMSAKETDEIYVRDGVKIIQGEQRLVHQAHRDSTCDYCEMPLHRESRHPVVDAELGVSQVCGGYFVRLIG